MVQSILRISQLLISLQRSHHEALISGFFSEWSRQVNDFSLMMSDRCSPSTIRSELDTRTGEIYKLSVTITSYTGDRLKQRLSTMHSQSNVQFEGYLA